MRSIAELTFPTPWGPLTTEWLCISKVNLRTCRLLNSMFNRLCGMNCCGIE